MTKAEVSSAVEKLDAQAVIPSVESKQSAPLETAHRRNNKTRLWAGFIEEGFVLLLGSAFSNRQVAAVTRLVRLALVAFTPLLANQTSPVGEKQSTGLFFYSSPRYFVSRLQIRLSSD